MAVAKAKLTEKLIESLSTDERQVDVFDARLRGAGIRVSRNGGKTFFMMYRSSAVRDAKGQPKLRRLNLGEHTSGRAGSGIYLNDPSALIKICTAIFPCCKSRSNRARRRIDHSRTYPAAAMVAGAATA